MPAIKVIFALSLVVSGMIGCASTERLYHRTASNTVQLPQIKPSPEKISPDPSPPAANLQPSSANAPATTEPLPPPRNPLAPPREVEPLSPKPLETKAERVDSREKTLPVPAKTSSSTAQRQGAFQADNRLLELLEKEIDKAVEQPPERRRLQFSKEVVGNPKVRHFLHYYSVTAKNSFEELLARSGKYMPMIAAVLAREGLPKELGYLALLESQLVLDST
jgi:hypothetical protein